MSFSVAKRDVGVVFLLLLISGLKNDFLGSEGPRKAFAAVTNKRKCKQTNFMAIYLCNEESNLGEENNVQVLDDEKRLPFQSQAKHPGFKFDVYFVLFDMNILM